MFGMTPSIYGTWLVRICDLTHSYVWHDSIHMCDMTHPHLWHTSFKCLAWLHPYVWYDSFTYVTCLIHVFGMTPSTCVTWLIHMCEMTHPHVWHDSIRVCDMTHSYVWNDSSAFVTCLIHMGVTWFTGGWKFWDRQHIGTGWYRILHERNIDLRDMPHPHAWHAIFIRVTCLIRTCATWFTGGWKLWDRQGMWAHTASVPQFGPYIRRCHSPWSSNVSHAMC